jgi:chromosome segregation ATPase
LKFDRNLGKVHDMTPIRPLHITIVLALAGASLATQPAIAHSPGIPSVSIPSVRPNVPRVDTSGAARSATTSARDAAGRINRSGGNSRSSSTRGADHSAMQQQIQAQIAAEAAARVAAQAAALDAAIYSVNSELLTLGGKILIAVNKVEQAKTRVAGTEGKIRQSEQDIAKLQAAIDEVRRDLSQLRRLKRGEHRSDPDNLPFDEWQHYDNQQKNAEQRLFDLLDRRAAAEAAQRQLVQQLNEQKNQVRQAEADRNVIGIQLAEANHRRSNLQVQRGQLPPSEQGTVAMLTDFAVQSGLWLAGQN